MKPLFWAAAAGAATATVLLIVRGTHRPFPSPVPPSPVEPPKVYGETTRVALAVPAGFRRATSAEVSALPELASQANALRSTSGFTSMPYGTLNPFVASNGQTYATWIEQHYHEPGGAALPWGYHHGVTVLARAA